MRTQSPLVSESAEPKPIDAAQAEDSSAAMANGGRFPALRALRPMTRIGRRSIPRNISMPSQTTNGARGWRHTPRPAIAILLKTPPRKIGTEANSPASSCRLMAGEAGVLLASNQSTFSRIDEWSVRT